MIKMTSGNLRVDNRVPPHQKKKILVAKGFILYLRL